MDRVSEKINGKRMGGLMKIRFWAVVLVTIATITSGVAFADGGITFPSVKFKDSDPIDFDMKAGLLAALGGVPAGSNSNANSGLSYWKCAVEERDNWDKLNDSLDIVTTGLLSWKALANSYQRTKLEYGYLNNVATLNNTWRMMDSALNYSTQQQIAYYQYRYGNNYGGYSNAGGNYNRGVGNYASDIYNGYRDSYDNWI